MTVAELRAALDALPAGADAWTVVLSRDSEGNGFSPLRDAGPGNYLERVPLPGDFCDVIECREDPTDPLPLNALCLWPVR